MERGNAAADEAIRFATLPAAARELGLGVDLLRQAVRSGDLAVYKIGSWPRVEWSELIAWARRQRRMNHAGNRP